MSGYIAWKNLSDTVTLTTPTGTMLRPLTELQIPFAKGLCRGPDNGGAYTPATLEIRFDMGAIVDIHAIALIGMNAVTYNEGFIALSNVGYGLSDAGAAAFFNLVVDNNDTFAQNAFGFFETGTQAQYITIEINVYGRGLGERYVDLRRLLVMTGGIFPAGFNRNWSTTTIDPSIKNTTPKGGVFVLDNTPYRQITFGIGGMSKAEAKTNYVASFSKDSMERCLQQAGKRKEVLITPRNYVSVEEQAQNSFYATLDDWTPIVHAGGDNYDIETITATEIPAPPL